jgi:hypothetical protein
MITPREDVSQESAASAKEARHATAVADQHAATVVHHRRGIEVEDVRVCAADVTPEHEVASIRSPRELRHSVGVPAGTIEVSK